MGQVIMEGVEVAARMRGGGCVLDGCSRFLQVRDKLHVIYDYCNMYLTEHKYFQGCSSSNVTWFKTHKVYKSHINYSIASFRES